MVLARHVRVDIEQDIELVSDQLRYLATIIYDRSVIKVISLNQSRLINRTPIYLLVGYYIRYRGYIELKS